MRISVQPKFLIFVANLLSPDSREGKKEALFGREAVDFLVAIFRMFIERLLQRGVGELYSADVGNVFALGQLAIDVQSLQRLVLLVLIDHRLSALCEFLC